MNQTEADQLLPDLKKQNVFVKNNPYYSYYSKNSNNPQKVFIFRILTKAQLDERVAFRRE